MLQNDNKIHCNTISKNIRTKLFGNIPENNSNKRNKKQGNGTINDRKKKPSPDTKTTTANMEANKINQSNETQCHSCVSKELENNEGNEKEIVVGKSKMKIFKKWNMKTAKKFGFRLLQEH